MAKHYLGSGLRHAMEGLAGGDGSAEGDADGAPQVLSIQSLSEQTSPVVRLLDATLFDALKAEASEPDHLSNDDAPGVSAPAASV